MKDYQWLMINLEESDEDNLAIYGEEFDLNAMASSCGINILSDRNEAILCVDNKTVLGAAVLATSGNSCTFDVFVPEPNRGQGIGKELVHLCVDYLTELQDQLGLESDQIFVDVRHPSVSHWLSELGWKHREGNLWGPPDW